MYPTSVFGFLLIGAGLLYFFRPQARFIPLVVCTGALTLAAGLLGAWLGISMALHTSAMALRTSATYTTDRLQEFRVVLVILEECGEYLNNLAFALVLIVVAGLLTLGGLLRSLRTPTGGAR